jgi:putative copper resistance protein D
MIHLLAAAVWLGSMVFFAIVIIPVVRRSLDLNMRKVIIKDIGFRYRILGYLTVVILLVTGPLLAEEHGIQWHSTFGTIFICKLVLVAVMLILLFLHDVIFAPKALSRQGISEESNKRGMAVIARVNLVIVVAIIVCGVLLTTV